MTKAEKQVNPEPGDLLVAREESDILGSDAFAHHTYMVISVSRVVTLSHDDQWKDVEIRHMFSNSSTTKTNLKEDFSRASLKTDPYDTIVNNLKRNYNESIDAFFWTKLIKRTSNED